MYIDIDGLRVELVLFPELNYLKTIKKIKDTLLIYCDGFVELAYRDGYLSSVIVQSEYGLERYPVIRDENDN